MNTATEKQSREEIFNDPQMGTYDKSLALAEWDKTHPPEPSAREEILSRGLSAYEAGQLIAKLPPEQPALPACCRENAARWRGPKQTGNFGKGIR